MTYFSCKKDIFFVSLLMTLPKISRFLSPVHIWCDQDFCHWLGLMINEVHCLRRETLSLSFFFQDWAQVIFCCNFDRAPVPQAPGCDTVKKKILLGVAGATLRLPDDDMNDNEMDKNFNRNSAEPKSKLAKNMDMQNNVGNVAIINHEKKVTQKCRKINLETMVVRFSWPKLCQQSCAK